MHTQFFLLHEIMPDFGALAAPVFFTGLGGFISLGVSVIIAWDARHRPVADRPAAPPALRIVLLAILIATAIWAIAPRMEDALPEPLVGAAVGATFLFSLPWLVIVRDDNIAFAIGSVWLLAGLLTSCWWALRFVRARRKAMGNTQPVAAVPSSRPTSAAAEACELCRAASGTIGNPLLKLGMKTKPLSSLYQCAVCRTYWRRDPHGMRTVSDAIAKQEFPELIA